MGASCRLQRSRPRNAPRGCSAGVLYRSPRTRSALSALEPLAPRRAGVHDGQAAPAHVVVYTDASFGAVRHHVEIVAAESASCFTMPSAQSSMLLSDQRFRK